MEFYLVKEAVVSALLQFRILVFSNKLLASFFD